MVVEGIQRGSVTVQYDDARLRLTSKEPLREIVTKSSAISVVRQHRPPRKTRLLNQGGKFEKFDSLLRQRFGEVVPVPELPMSPPPGLSSHYFSRDELLEIARGIYGNNQYGNELVKYLYVTLTSLGAEGGMLRGTFQPERMISIAPRDSVLRGYHGVLAYVAGEHLSRPSLRAAGYREAFHGYLGIRLPHLQGQRPEVFVMSAGIPNLPETGSALDGILAENPDYIVGETADGLHLAVNAPVSEGHRAPTANTIVGTMNYVAAQYVALVRTDAVIQHYEKVLNVRPPTSP